MTTDNLLGQFLRDRRSRLDPVAFGFPAGRRRTPGLRREEVAQRSNISPTWYTWLEQGRGGAPSADVLERLARGLMLTPVEREHLFMIGLGRPPEVHYKAVDGVTPRLQRLLDALETSPALIKTATWDVVAWNRAAALVLTDYAALPPGRRNILRLMFGDPRVKAAQHDWEGLTRFVVGAFRADATRAGASSEIGQLVDELCQLSPEFAALWRDNDVRAHGEGVKRLTHPLLGLIELEFSAFAVDGRTDLSMIVYNPVDRSVADRIRALTRNAVAPKEPPDIRQEPSMSEPLQYQLRVYLGDQDAATARVDRRSPSLAPLTKILDRHDATLVCQLDAFEAYVAQAETAGTLEDPLYKWTKATVQNPAMRAKHGGSFAIRVGGEEVYAKPLADALESELSPIVGGGIVQRMSRHDTDPAKNIPIPAEYRAPRS